MINFKNHKNSTFFLSVVAIALYFSNISLAYISYQVNDRIFEDEKGKYFLSLEKSIQQRILQLEKRIKQKRLEKEHDLKKKMVNILSKFHTGLNPYQVKQTARVIRREGEKYGYDPLFILAIMRIESSFYNRAVSSVGARGLMQLMPFTAKEIATETNRRWRGKKTLYNPFLNVKMGTYYLYKMENKFGNLQLALEAYNNGPRRLNQLLDKGFVPTRYSNKVFNYYERIKQGRV